METCQKEVSRVVVDLLKEPEKQQGTNRPLKPPIMERKGETVRIST